MVINAQNLIFNYWRKLGIVSFVLLSGCVSSISPKENQTLYVANDYLVYQNQRYTNIAALKRTLPCDKPSEVFISPLVGTSSTRLSQATADFLKMCGKIERITIEVEEQS